MAIVLRVLSAAALAGMLVLPVLFFAGSLTQESMQAAMGGATLLWFVTAPLWMERKPGA